MEAYIIRELAKMGLEQAIKEWEVKASINISDIYEQYHREPDFVENLFRLIRGEVYQKGVTWLVKRHCEQGNQFTESDAKLIFGTLPGLGSWSSKLHILQCMPYILVPKCRKESIVGFLRMNLSDKNKFVRAWTYNGFYEFSQQYPEYKDETEQLLEMAMRDEAPSVKARIRHIRKKNLKSTS